LKTNEYVDSNAFTNVQLCFLHNGSKSSYSNKSPSGRVMASNAGGSEFSLRQGKHWFFLKKHKKTTTILRALWKI